VIDSSKLQYSSHHSTINNNVLDVRIQCEIAEQLARKVMEYSNGIYFLCDYSKTFSVKFQNFS